MSQTDTKAVSARPVKGKKLFLFGLPFAEENLVDRMNHNIMYCPVHYLFRQHLKKCPMQVAYLM
jgi:hypothetical protein